MIRKKTEQETVLSALDNNTIIDTAVEYFDRKSDHGSIREAIKRRYGLGIQNVTDPTNSSATIETYSREATEIQVDTGMWEAISIGYGHKVASALANLFTEQGHDMSLKHETLDETQLEDATLLLLENRVQGDFDDAIVSADIRSIQVGSCAILVGFSGGALTYDTLPPSAVKFLPSEYIIDKETGEERVPKSNDIEDCYAVTLRLGASTLAEYNYLTIMGRSGEYPQGRYVQYKSSVGFGDIPEVGDESIVSEYLVDGSPANPLSVVANRFPDLPIPEYPIAIIKGVVKDNSTPMPWSTSLYQDCLEFDTAASHILSSSQKAARGTDVLSIDEVGRGQPLPRTLEGLSVTQPGQTLEHVSMNAADADTAYDTLKKTMIDNASGYNVPDFMVTSSDYTVEASSGIALEVKSKPLIKARQRRIKEHRTTVAKLFSIEKNLIEAHAEADSAVIQTLVECIQIWNPGNIVLPENKKEAVERLSAALKEGIIDQVEAIREYYKFNTDEEAIAMYNTLKERKVEYPSLAAETKPKTKFGLNSKGVTNE